VVVDPQSTSSPRSVGQVDATHVASPCQFAAATDIGSAIAAAASHHARSKLQ
jgi:hypothetical protein